jgi:hypothetical protein
MSIRRESLEMDPFKKRQCWGAALLVGGAATGFAGFLLAFRFLDGCAYRIGRADLASDLDGVLFPAILVPWLPATGAFLFWCAGRLLFTVENPFRKAQKLIVAPSTRGGNASRWACRMIQPLSGLMDIAGRNPRVVAALQPWPRNTGLG